MQGTKFVIRVAKMWLFIVLTLAVHAMADSGTMLTLRADLDAMLTPLCADTPAQAAEETFLAPTRETLYQQAAMSCWTITEPSVPVNSSYQPLHDTLFSHNAYKYTYEYRHPELDPVESLPTVITARVMHLEKKTEVHFYKDVTWFSTHRIHIKRFGAWCDDNTGGDYYLTQATVYGFMEYSIKTKREEIIQKYTGDAGADLLPEVTVWNYLRVVVATLERLALWQGVQEYTKSLTTKDPFGTLYKEVMREALTARASRPIDFVTYNRAHSKRITVEERELINETLFTNPDNVLGGPLKQMRVFAMDKLADACGRRGMDLRGVSQTHLYLQFAA